MISSVINEEQVQYYSNMTDTREMTYEELYKAMTEKVFGQDQYVEALCMTVMNSRGVNMFLQKQKG